MVPLSVRVTIASASAWMSRIDGGGDRRGVVLELDVRARRGRGPALVLLDRMVTGPSGFHSGPSFATPCWVDSLMIGGMVAIVVGFGRRRHDGHGDGAGNGVGARQEPQGDLDHTDEQGDEGERGDAPQHDLAVGPVADGSAGTIGRCGGGAGAERHAGAVAAPGRRRSPPACTREPRWTAARGRWPPGCRRCRRLRPGPRAGRGRLAAPPDRQRLQPAVGRERRGDPQVRDDAFAGRVGPEERADVGRGEDALLEPAHHRRSGGATGSRRSP